METQRKDIAVALGGLIKNVAYVDTDSESQGDHTLTVGHTWSTVMHMDALPLALTEPTVSGALFTRQPQIRWSQRVNDGFTWSAAIEDASSSDVFTNQPSELGATTYPDAALSLDFYRGKAHFAITGLLRDIKVDVEGRGNRDTLGWGTAVSAVFRPTESDKLALYGTYGEALGRYLLGISPADGAAIDPIENDLKARDNWGAYAAWVHRRNAKWQGSVIAGYAQSDPLDFQSGSTLDNTQYAAANVFWNVLPYLTLGAEYGYGRRENADGTDLDNHRIMFGVQVF